MTARYIYIANGIIGYSAVREMQILGVLFMMKPWQKPQNPEKTGPVQRAGGRKSVWLRDIVNLVIYCFEKALEGREGVKRSLVTAELIR